MDRDIEEIANLSDENIARAEEWLDKALSPMDSHRTEGGYTVDQLLLIALVHTGIAIAQSIQELNRE